MISRYCCRLLQQQLAASEDNAQQLQQALAVAQARKTEAEQARSKAQTVATHLQEQLTLSEDSAASLQSDLDAAQARAAEAEQTNAVLAHSQVGTLRRQGSALMLFFHWCLVGLAIQVTGKPAGEHFHCLLGSWPSMTYVQVIT